MSHPDKVRRWLRDPGVEIGAFKTPIPGIRPVYVDKFAEFAHEKCLADYYGEAIALLFVTLVVTLIAMSAVLKMGRADDRLERWAQDHRLRFISKEAHWRARGSFSWTTGKFQPAYRITVEDAEGRLRSGWARPGGGPLRLWSDQVDVRWDPPKAAEPGGGEVYIPADRTNHGQ